MDDLKEILNIDFEYNETQGTIDIKNMPVMLYKSFMTAVSLYNYESENNYCIDAFVSEESEFSNLKNNISWIISERFKIKYLDANLQYVLYNSGSNEKAYLDAKDELNKEKIQSYLDNYVWPKLTRETSYQLPNPKGNKLTRLLMAARILQLNITTSIGYTSNGVLRLLKNQWDNNPAFALRHAKKIKQYAEKLILLLEDFIAEAKNQEDKQTVNNIIECVVPNKHKQFNDKVAPIERVMLI